MDLKAYYNAGSAALVLLLVLLAFGTSFWCRMRGRRVQLLPFRGILSQEESMPLNSNVGRLDEESGGHRLRKVKNGDAERQTGVQAESIFEIGDSDDEEGHWSETKNPSAR